MKRRELKHNVRVAKATEAVTFFSQSLIFHTHLPSVTQVNAPCGVHALIIGILETERILDNSPLKLNEIIKVLLLLTLKLRDRI